VFSHFPIINGRIDEEIQAREALDTRMQESLQDLQHQINQIKDSNRRFEQEIENQGKEGMLNDRFLAQGNISGY
jgi:flagellar biosynthesis chaperone FliJ